MNALSSANAAMVLIDHQVGTMGWVKGIERAELERNATVLAKAAVVLDMPIVLTTSVEEAAQGRLMPSLETIAPDAYARRVRRGGIVNSWSDEAFASAVRATDRKNLIMAGVTTDVCLAPVAISAAAEGFSVHAVVDASGGTSSLADEMAFRRMEQGGITLTTTVALLSEVARDWSSDDGSKLFQIMVADLLNGGS